VATKWLVGMAMIYVVMSVVDGIAGGTYLGGGGATIWSAMTGFQAIDVTNPLTAVGGVLIQMWQILVGVFEILTWNFPHIFVGVWSIVRWVLCAISLGIIISLIMALRGVSSG